MKRLAAALVAVLFAAGCGGGGEAPKLITETVGSGPLTTTIIRPDVDRKLPVVLFLHGWGGNRPRYYRPWLEHLARAGNAVIYPRYQDSIVEPPPQVLGNVLAGTRLALERVNEDRGSLVVAGHSAGGALAADYAGIARSVGLPVPIAVFSAYPGRKLPRLPVRDPGGRPGADPGGYARWSRSPARTTASSARGRRGGSPAWRGRAGVSWS